MGWIVERDEIIESLKKHKTCQGDELIIWGQYKQGLPGYSKPSVLINPTKQGMWLAISRKDIKILPITFVRGKLRDTIFVVNAEDMVEFTLKKGIFYYNLTIKTKDDNVIIFNIGRVLAGNKQHHEDLMKLVDRLK